MILQTSLPDGQGKNKILRRVAEGVADPKFAEIKTLINKMAEAMFAEPDGVGIAAPQIGIGLRVFLVAKDALSYSSKGERYNSSPHPPPLKIRGGGEEGVELSSQAKRRENGYFVFINPVIKKFSQKKTKDIEGCLSVRGVYGEVTRPEKLTIEYFDESGKKHARGASGLLARVIQHEADHLNGVLFIDKAEKIHKT